jgi:hypothetical protein
MLTIEKDDDGGCYRLIDDGIGLCTSKSRNVLVRIRDALNAVRETGLVGLTVACGADPGVVLALCSGPPQLVVRRANGQLHTWMAADCRVIEPAPPDRDTPSNEPPIGVLTACELLTRWLHEYGDPDAIEAATKKFLADRRAAEPVP